MGSSGLAVSHHRHWTRKVLHKSCQWKSLIDGYNQSPKINITGISCAPWKQGEKSHLLNERQGQKQAHNSKINLCTESGEGTGRTAQREGQVDNLLSKEGQVLLGSWSKPARVKAGGRLWVSWGRKYCKEKKMKRKRKGGLGWTKSNPTTIRDYKTSGSAASWDQPYYNYLCHAES